MDQELTDLSHLHDAAQQVARLPAAERLRHVRADRWIGYTRATEALARLETLFEWPARQRMPNLLLTGPTNNGKSMIIEKFRRTHPPKSCPDREHIPVLAVQMPSDPSVNRVHPHPPSCQITGKRTWRSAQSRPSSLEPPEGHLAR